MRIPRFFVSAGRYREMRSAMNEAALETQRQHRDQITILEEGYRRQIDELRTQITGLTNEKEAAIDRLMWLGIGVPMYHQIEAAAPAPSAEELPAARAAVGVEPIEDNGMPRAAIMRSPRRHTRAVTNMNAIGTNQNEAERTISAMTNALQREATARALLIQKKAEEKASS